MQNKAILELTGRLDFLQKERVFQFIRLLPQNTTEVIFDFENVTSIDSSGIGLLISVRGLLRPPLKDHFCLNNCNEVIIRSLHAAGMNILFDIRHSANSNALRR